ncbi:glycosyl hydrolase family 28-related protein [Virgibacillus sp. C22-A2]|uniref:Glycosyl hydrolase family 28-related protein n=1 Tax=Virgibacillus tibetensis TaxID=3042313 RepID=A0ABU6KC81_9BACI|nr:glycosyl hydrolase family 28-related protein [Virgibacillus sp. C22-A2]
MAITNLFELKVDFKIKNTYTKMPEVVQNDSIRFVINITDDGKPLEEQSITYVSLASVRQGGTTVVTSGTLEDSKAIFDLGTSETERVGKVTAMVQLYDEENRISTVQFSYNVIKDPTGAGYEPSESEQTLIQVVMADAQTVMDNAQARIDELNGVDATQFYERQNEFESSLAEIATNVKIFGAKGDGITDDTESIQNAMDHVATAGGGTVYFPSGEYIVSATIKGNGDNISVIGEGYSSHINAQSDFSIFYSEGYDNLRWTKLRITGSRIDDTYAGYGHGIRVDNANNVLIENNYIEAIDGKGVHLSGFNTHNETLPQGVHDGWVINNYIDWCGDAIMVYNDGRRVEVAGNKIFRCTNIGIYIDDSHQQAGVEIPRKSTRINVENNVIENMIGTVGINLAGTDYSAARGNYIINGGQTTDPKKNVNGISIQTVQNHIPAEHNIIEGNTIVGHTNIAIDLIGASYNIIRNNNLIDNSLNRNSGGAQSISLQSNTIREVLFGSNHNIIENNKSFVGSTDSTLGTHVRIVDVDNTGNIIRFNKMDGGIYHVGDNGTDTMILENIFNGQMMDVVEGFKDGSYSSPSIHFTSDPDTGFYRRSDGELAFVSNGERTVYFRNGMTFLDGKDIQFGSGTGSRFGSSPAQKMAFWGAIPIAQPENIPQTSAATLVELEQEVNKLKFMLKKIGLMS